jgi:hypothetical protein
LFNDNIFPSPTPGTNTLADTLVKVYADELFWRHLAVFIEREVPRERLQATIKLLHSKAFRPTGKQPMDSVLAEETDEFYLQVLATHELQNLTRLMQMPIALDGLAALFDDQQQAVIDYLEPRLNLTERCVSHLNLFNVKESARRRCRDMFEDALMPFKIAAAVRTALSKHEVANNFEARPAKAWT